MNLLTLCNKVISFSFYALFLLVPIVFTADNSELFELSKMWLTWGLTTIIVSAWISKMIIEKRFIFQRTPLDIPLALFFLGQFLATIISLDPRVSLWGYYSRFNGGLLSTVAYILLFYAFVSNLGVKQVYRVIFVSLISGLFVLLWGLPSHYGYDPTCLVVRGTLDISCWTESFVPTVRMFSTLGQPAWLAAYLSFLLPIVMALTLQEQRKKFLKNKWFVFFATLLVLFYIGIIFANTRAGIIASGVGFVVFWVMLFWARFNKRKYLLKSSLTILIALFITTFVFGIPIPQFQRFTLPQLMTQSQSQPQPTQTQSEKTSENEQEPTQENNGSGITDSGNIRLNVWEGAINAWKKNPLFGTGVETFAFAYYQYKPIEQNLTSEWDFLYNKAHNEYLNYLATTGIIGFGTYLLVIGYFLFLVGIYVLRRQKSPEGSTHKLFSIELDPDLVAYGLVAGYTTLLVTNFFGFSVVIVSLYFFLTPAFVLLIFGKLPSNELSAMQHKKPKSTQWIGISVVILIAIYFLLLLIKFWNADKAYALGSNLNRVGEFVQAHEKLKEAYVLRSTEPVFIDELAYNNAAIAAGFIQQQNPEMAQTYLNDALMQSNLVGTNHPNNVVFLKNRVRLFYLLSQVDTRYLGMALESIQKAKKLAPSDAKISYNFGVLLGQTGSVEEGIKELEQTLKLRPNYRDAYFALGLFYRELATDGTETVKNPEYQTKADEALNYILEKLNPNDSQAQETLDSWK